MAQYQVSVPFTATVRSVDENGNVTGTGVPVPQAVNLRVEADTPQLAAGLVRDMYAALLGAAIAGG